MKSCKTASLLFISILLLVAACTLPLQTIQSQYDIATNTKNFRWDHRIFGFMPPLVTLEQSFVKQLDENQQVEFRLYDVVILRPNQFRLEDKVFMLLDDKPVSLQVLRREDDVKIVHDDPMDVSVVGSNESRYPVTRLEYVFSSEVVEQMKSAKSIQFRYYSGPDIITISFSHEKVLQLKKLLASV
ncbi:MAG: hypothetical protein J0L67_14670 [Cytophagales bacterium]|nr:hypothetical protein [Cytophagales bacterium]